uniref:Secreted protein n=1 Tax=Ascaris lumbricoides TaxID=6252 RepID=A0A0M3HF05_ASCLU
MLLLLFSLGGQQAMHNQIRNREKVKEHIGGMPLEKRGRWSTRRACSRTQWLWAAPRVRQT